MQVFGNYASYYDLLYRDKNYVGEANYVRTLIEKFMPNAKTLLELGCGTGIHASLLADKGYEICGVDRSKEMLESAQQRLSTLSQEQASKLKFVLGDLQTVRLDKKFDVVISLFHVVSYQTANQELQAAFATAKAHLKPGGIFLFDCWYGPAVLSDRPMVRVKRLESEKIQVTRIAEPVLHPNQNTVDVNYQVLIRDRHTDAVEELQEVHTMRYLFKPEVDWLFSQHQFDSIAAGEWMTDREPACDTWNVYFVGRSQAQAA